MYLYDLQESLVLPYYLLQKVEINTVFKESFSKTGPIISFNDRAALTPFNTKK